MPVVAPVLTPVEDPIPSLDTAFTALLLSVDFSNVEYEIEQLWEQLWVRSRWR